MSQQDVERERLVGRIVQAIRGAERVLITSQLDPDGDSVGSQLALRRMVLAELGGDGAADRVAIVNQVRCPRRYGFLPDAGAIVTPEDVRGRSFDLGFVLDGGADRTGSVRPLFEACATKVIIDHHKTTRPDGYDIPFIEPQMSSTAEMVYTLVEDPRSRAVLDKATAAQIYMGIIYDTGAFQYALTTARTHRVAAALLEQGIHHADIAERAMLEGPLNAKVLLGRGLSSMRITSAGRIAWTSVTRDLADETRATDEDVRAIITQMIFIEGVKVALLFYERERGRTKLSLRSREGFDVASFARQLDPGGGGHARASGCTLPGTPDQVAPKVVEQLEELLGEPSVVAAAPPPTRS